VSSGPAGGLAIRRPPVALTVAGSDSSGGAGIQADLATFLAFGVHGACAVTAVTAQDTAGVGAVHAVPAAVVAEQVARACGDLRVAAAKTGMLAQAATVEAVAAALGEAGIRALVVDPVLASTSGTPLLGPGGLPALRDRLLPMALVVTPNLAEASALTGREVAGLPGMREAARALHAGGAAWVLVTGGHLAGSAIDLLFDGETFAELPGPRLESPHLHGTGCVLSAAITAGLAGGAAVPEAVQAAKEHVTGAIRHGLDVGRGGGCVGAAWSLRPGPAPPETGADPQGRRRR
jgi:hydroxymethylpyrimidine/phosphomethylpyrimidine kinase